MLTCKMIKKNTKAVFLNGDFKGEYDWQGGIPLSKGEVMVVKLKGKVLQYTLRKKEVICTVDGLDQSVDVLYEFGLR